MHVTTSEFVKEMYSIIRGMVFYILKEKAYEKCKSTGKQSCHSFGS